MDCYKGRSRSSHRSNLKGNPLSAVGGIDARIFIDVYEYPAGMGRRMANIETGRHPLQCPVMHAHTHALLAELLIFTVLAAWCLLLRLGLLFPSVDHLRVYTPWLKA